MFFWNKRTEKGQERETNDEKERNRVRISALEIECEKISTGFRKFEGRFLDIEAEIDVIRSKVLKRLQSKSLRINEEETNKAPADGLPRFGL